MAKKKKKKGSVIGRIFSTFLLILALGVFVIAAWKLIGYYLDYKAGSDEYDNLNDLYVVNNVEPETAAEVETEDPGYVLTDVEELEDPDTVEEVKSGAATGVAVEDGEEVVLPLLTNPIDFTSLNAINDEIIGWIRIGAIDISYPIAQADDNDFYLHRTFEKQDNFAGCIFLNYENSRYFTDQNSIIYGHNMKNGSMFGKLKRFQDQETYDSNPYFWIFTPTLIYQYRIFSCHVVSATGDPYRFRFATAEFEEFLQEMKSASLVENDVEVTSDDRIVTLSTCTGNSETRFIVQGVVEQVYKSAN